MGLGGVEGPPKKKLKQAQLSFCVSTEKASNKRKLSDSSEGLAPKLFRTELGTPKTPVTPKTQVFNKENVVVVSNIDKTKDDVQKKAEPESDVVVILDDDSKGDKPESGATQNKAIKESRTVDDSLESKSNNHGDRKAETEPTQIKPPENKIGAPTSTKINQDEAKGDLTEAKGDSISKDETETTDSKAQNGQVATNEVDSNDSRKPMDSESEKDHADSMLDKSVESEQGVNTSIVVSSEDEQVSSPTLKITPIRKIIVTPKSSAKKAERERQREEKLRLKKEKEEQKLKEKEEKEKKKQEELRLKEEEKKRKDEERKRKEEEKKRKEEERKKKEEAKEEERRKREEEKKKKEEDRRKKEEARLAEERKENLAKAAFTKFFITEKSKPSLPKKEELEAESEKTERSKFMPFPVKSDMRLAAQVRRTLIEEEKNVLSEALLSSQPIGNTYLKELRNGRKPKTKPATWPLSNEQHDVIIVESVDDDKADIEQDANSKTKSKGQRAKLLQFHENRRPPYWGTWRKPSKAVGPRRPFGQDKILDYEVDSESEWEDEEEGEDIEKEEGDSDKEEADDENVGENGYMLDNTFVPHGYLSDEEADEAEDDDSVENQKLKLTVLKQEFDQELKSKTQRLQPRLLGCVRIPNTTLEASKSIYELLMKMRCKWDNENPIDVTSPAVVECCPSPSVSNTKFPSSMVEQLAKLIHGSRSSMKALISEFMSSCDKDTQLSAVSKRAVFLKVKEIATKTYSVGSGRLVWAVNPDLCAEFGLEPIVDPPKTVSVISPVVEHPKPKDSPLANFLKKGATPQGPVKRVTTTLIPRDGRETPSSRGHDVVHIHIDTPRPKVTPQGSILASHAMKPIRRVSTTLLSSVAGPVKNKTYNVCEIDKPGQFPISNQRKTVSTVSTKVDLTDSIEGITPLPDEVDQLVPPVPPDFELAKSHVRSTSLADPPVSETCDSSAHPVVPSDLGDPPQTSVKDASNTVAGGSVGPTINGAADSTNKTFEPSPMETDAPVATIDAGLPAFAGQMDSPATMELADATSTITQSSPMDTDDLPEPLIEVKASTTSNDSKPATDSSDAISPTNTDAKAPTLSSDAKQPAITEAKLLSVSTDDKAQTVSSDAKPPTITGAEPPTLPSNAKQPTVTDAKLSSVSSDDKAQTVSSDAKPPTLPSNAKRPTITDAKLSTVSSDAKAETVASDAKPLIVSSNTSEAPPTPTPSRKRVPLVTLSKSLSKTKRAKSPGRTLSIADMFGRKPAKNDAPSKPVTIEPPAVVDLSANSD